MANLRFLGISGSLRRQSRNTGLLRTVAKRLPAGVDFEVADLSDIPFYNADLPAKPASVERVLAQMTAADALVLACPEYNYSLAPALKNIIDWASREPDCAPIAGKGVAIMGAGGGMGTSRSQHHLRQVCVFVDLKPLNRPEVFSNAFSSSFDDDGNLVDEKIANLIGKQMEALAAWTLQLRPR